MALRLRRGTNAERLTITPVEGELIYTTDTKLIYMGDGTTVGGIIITGEFSLGDLTEVDLSTPPTVGQVLKWDGSRFVPGNDLEGNSNISSIFDLNNVFAFTPPDVNDVLSFDGVNFTPRKITQIEGADSNLMLDATTNTFTGNFIGDGSGLTNLPGGNGDGVIEGSDYRISILGDDGSLMLDATTNTFTGNFIGGVLGNVFGNVRGDVVGSVFSDDSTVLIDGIDGNFIPNYITSKNNNLEIVSESSGINRLQVLATDNKSILRLTYNSDADLTGQPLEYGSIFFERIDANGDQIRSLITGYNDGLFVLVADVNNDFPENNVFLINSDGNAGFGTFSPTAKLDVRGDAVISGGLTADVIGSVFADDSTILVDGVNGTLPYPANVGVVWDGIRPETVADALDRLALYTQDYSVIDPTDWNGTPPTTVIEAIDRLAAVVKTLNGGTGA